MGVVALVIGVAGLIAGGLALAAHLQPELLASFGVARSDSQPQRAALEALSVRGEDVAVRLETLESRVAESARTLESLSRKQAAFDSMTERTGALVERMDTVAIRLDGARRRIDALSEGVRDSDVGERVGALAGDVEQLESAIASAAEGVQAAEKRLAATLAGLDSRFADLVARTRLLEAVRPEHVAGAAAVALAVGQLRAAVLEGQSFSGALGNVRALLAREDGMTSEGADSLQTLGRYAADGVSTLAVLRRRFAEQASVILRAGTATTDGWMGETLQRLAAVVTVRRTGEVPGTGTEARLARAEARLEAGDIAAAVAEISALVGPSAEAAAAWLRSARARHAAEMALADLEAFAVSQIATIRDATQSTGHITGQTTGQFTGQTTGKDQ